MRLRLFKKGTPASAPTDTGAGTARERPARLLVECFLSAPVHSRWTGVIFYLALDASKRTIATAISRTEAIRFIGLPPLACAVPSADKFVEGNRAEAL